MCSSPSLRRLRAFALMTTMWSVSLSCGIEQDDSNVTIAYEHDAVGDSDSPIQLMMQAASGPRVQVCGIAAPATLGFDLLAGETYAGNILPVVNAKCVRCHAGNGNNGQQNSTTCGFLESNIDAVIVRMQNSLDGEERKIIEDAKADGDPTKLNNDGIRDLVSGSDFKKYPMPPIGQNNERRLIQDDLNIFKAWKKVPGKCVDVSEPDDPLDSPTAYTDDEEQLLKKGKLFEAAGCQDGPAVAGDRAQVTALLTLPADSPSPFYDYEARAFVDGARKFSGNCTIDYFIEALAVVPGAVEALQAYKDYGWWATQCAIVDGRPQAYLAHVAKVTTALGDTTYGVFLKLLKVTDQ